MRSKVWFTLFVWSLVIAVGAAQGWGQELQKSQVIKQHEILTQYHTNLSRIPKTLPPEQRRILEMRYKHQMMYERWLTKLPSSKAAAAAKEPAENH